MYADVRHNDADVVPAGQLQGDVDMDGCSFHSNSRAMISDNNMQALLAESQHSIYSDVKVIICSQLGGASTIKCGC